MDAVHAAGCQVHNLVYRVGDSRVPHGNGVIPVPLHHGDEFFRQLYAAQGYHALNLLFVDHRHDSGLHRNMDSNQIHPFPEAVKILVVKEKLGDKLADTSVHLIF